jgi:hypothetical protein
MRADPHVRARSLVDRALIEAISQDEERWLGSHVQACAECREYSDLSLQAIRALDGFAFPFDPEAALGVQQAVLQHAQRLPERDRTFAAAAFIAILLTIIGSILVWQLAAWIGPRWQVSPRVWQPAVLLLWLLPSAAVDLLLIFRRQFGHAS